ncbi:tRNA-dependent cyclodipeptide synthase [Streptomyces cacaoi]|uniref:tRNA-dependent cyclodipeptide synthase n=1 Tax=Streptomyces cacaoi TaxID=1898 RepID=UPI0037495F24
MPEPVRPRRPRGGSRIRDPGRPRNRNRVRRGRRRGTGGTGGDATALALEYLIDELPFFIDTPSILGVPSSLACYHAPVGFADLLYTEDGPLHAAANQGFVLLKDHVTQQ